MLILAIFGGHKVGNASRNADKKITAIAFLGGVESFVQKP